MQNLKDVADKLKIELKTKEGKKRYQLTPEERLEAAKDLLEYLKLSYQEVAQQEYATILDMAYLALIEPKEADAFFGSSKPRSRIKR
ncbi:MAG: hypothetical protein OIN66_11670 [Candidatus Methanoperedens sp.]|nr:hypothetical protein [Candidatus Methanoperedens sp.]